jgi:CDP-diglyceride synthetase
VGLDELTGDPLRFYTVAAIVTIAVVSALLAALRLPGAWIPLRTWFLILPIALGAMWLGREAWTVLIAVVSIAAFREFARVTGLDRQRLFVLLVYGGVITENCFAYLDRYDVFMAIPTWAVLSLALVPIVLRRTDGMLHWYALSIVAVVFYAYFLAHLSYLFGSSLGLGYLLFVLLMTQLNDALQYIYGKAVGRHRWTPISPNKTVEGSVLAGATVVLLAFRRADRRPHDGQRQAQHRREGLRRAPARPWRPDRPPQLPDGRGACLRPLHGLPVRGLPAVSVRAPAPGAASSFVRGTVPPPPGRQPQAA